MTEKEIMQALRCSATREEREKCEMCRKSKHGCLECIDSYVHEAADLVERLTAENASLREHNRWIPVTEKTPEYDMPQLALNADGDALIANYAYGEWFDTWGQDVEVTHWMPLPEAPEEKHESV